MIRLSPTRKKFILLSFLLVLGLCWAVVYFCNRAVVNAARGRLYNNVDAVPYNKVGLLLGTAKHLANGRVNLYYRYRIDAAVALFQAGKIRYLVVSGDNGQTTYNEPETMRADLVAAGIDSAQIFLDHAGFRTFDSMVRLREIFGQSAVTVISQPFHNQRALYIASREGINAIGFNARDVNPQAGAALLARERLARVKVFLDYLFGKQPRFLGPKVGIPG